jgi:dTDP-4-dehydrorhamnose 3,5-epimerase
VKFTPLVLAGATVVETEPHVDERGIFARIFCKDEFAKAGLPAVWPQMNISFNEQAGTVRGMHFQRAPFEEPKLVRCTRGRVHDVIIDLRRNSASYLQHIGLELCAEKRNAIFVPAGFAHGFQTLAPGSEVLYLMGTSFAAEAQEGLRWDDPACRVDWPLNISSISKRDSGYPDFVVDQAG